MSYKIGCIDHGFKGDGAGYARIKHYVDGKLVREGRHVKALRDKLGLPVGGTKGMVVRHKCDNPRCINPEHLELGTYSDNTQDMLKRKRNKTIVPLGQNNGRCKLTDEQVQEIRTRYVKRCPTNGAKALSKLYNVTSCHILYVAKGLTRTQGTGSKEYTA